jgi:hypothetical protein
LILSLTKKVKLSPIWERDYRTLSAMYDWFVEHIYEEFYDLITGQSLGKVLDNIEIYRKSIHGELLEKPTGKRFVDPGTIEVWQIFGFIDDNARSTCRPSGGEIGITQDEQAIQDSFDRHIHAVCSQNIIWKRALSHRLYIPFFHSKY